MSMWLHSVLPSTNYMCVAPNAFFQIKLLVIFSITVGTVTYILVWYLNHSINSVHNWLCYCRILWLSLSLYSDCDTVDYPYCLTVTVLGCWRGLILRRWNSRCILWVMKTKLTFLKMTRREHTGHSNRRLLLNSLSKCAPTALSLKHTTLLATVESAYRVSN